MAKNSKKCTDCAEKDGFSCKYRYTDVCSVPPVLPVSGRMCSLYGECAVCLNAFKCNNVGGTCLCKNSNDDMPQFTFDISDVWSYN